MRLGGSAAFLTSVMTRTGGSLRRRASAIAAPIPRITPPRAFTDSLVYFGRFALV